MFETAWFTEGWEWKLVFVSGHLHMSNRSLQRHVHTFAPNLLPPLFHVSNSDVLCDGLILPGASMDLAIADGETEALKK